MEEFLTKLYSYENFSTYLIVAIIILIILFFVILFFGNKDKKEREIEATKKLMKINEESLNNELEVENKKEEKDVLENDTIMVPNINAVSNQEVALEPVKEPVIEPTIPVPEEVSTPVMDDMPIIPEVISEPEVDSTLPDEIGKEFELVDTTPAANAIDAFKEEPVVSPVETPINDFEPVLFNEEAKPLVVDEPEFAPVNNDANVPEFSYDEIIKNVENVIKDEDHEIRKAPEVFSSVYIKEEKKEAPKKVESEDEIELPALKKEPKEKSIEDKIEIPEINSFNFDEIAGETYNIK